MLKKLHNPSFRDMRWASGRRRSGLTPPDTCVVGHYKVRKLQVGGSINGAAVSRPVTCFSLAFNDVLSSCLIRVTLINTTHMFRMFIYAVFVTEVHK